MIVLSNTDAQTIEPGQSIMFNEEILRMGNSECHRKGTSTVKLRANCAVYRLSFTGNVSSATANVQIRLAMTAGSDTLGETVMIDNVNVANNIHNVHAETLFPNCCGDYDRIAITNIGTDPVIIEPNPSFIVNRA